jgi:hypothetical protein
MMTIGDLHLFASPEELQARYQKLNTGFIAAFRQAAAWEGFSFGVVKLKATDLNRIHAVVAEIDSRRVFYGAYEDEIPWQVIESISEARTVIRNSLKGIWADTASEYFVQEILNTLADFMTEVERIGGKDIYCGGEQWPPFCELLGTMRLTVWMMIAHLKQRAGDVIMPTHLPAEIWKDVCIGKK